ncbi:hypothetical protein BTB_502p01140 (plasmid) [Bacillus thuringiensis Bt407]|uniref:Uncharacterized protein n=1 Tax=Bacillus thuringiensis T01-328 TaxID=1324966 RepID=A0AAN4KQY8_BACTU|nr:hypothetical protein [Bacillus thuringiensis]AFV21450.1 hypothetical protein BTB_502p01140 [Bacillus thuringiensis Bt407]MEC3068045.1 hypothetical protein [Bacillus cereus]PQZ78181.1 hypothetical protein CQ064_10240 [Bacillus sp. MYb78]ERI01374.1 hypothetical protein BTCBT_002962 [Bacillus thuringiensis T01-328]MBN6708102.1 hypothetical protein [Bacillus thuringiensis]
MKRVQFFREIDRTIRTKKDGNNNEENIDCIRNSIFIKWLCGLPEKDVKLQFLNNNAEVVKELKIDDYEIMDGELKYRIGKKVYISQYAPFIIEGEKSTED